MYGNYFYNQTTRRLVAVFGTHFNDIKINRKANDGSQIQEILVPIAYGPVQKFLARLNQDPTFSSPAISLPRMSFEIVGIQYAPERKLLGTQRLVGKADADPKSLQTVYVPTPMDVNFQLNIMVKYNEDGMKIVEQIIPFFKPSVTPSVKMLDDVEQYFDIPIVLNGVTQEDAYDSSFEERRVLIWTLDFTMKAYYFSGTSNKKVIKFANAHVYSTMDAESKSSIVNVYPKIPGENTEPADIEIDDNYIIVTEIEDG